MARAHMNKAATDDGLTLLLAAAGADHPEILSLLKGKKARRL